MVHSCLCAGKKKSRRKQHQFQPHTRTPRKPLHIALSYSRVKMKCQGKNVRDSSWLTFSVDRTSIKQQMSQSAHVTRLHTPGESVIRKQPTQALFKQTYKIVENCEQRRRRLKSESHAQEKENSVFKTKGQMSTLNLPKYCHLRGFATCPLAPRLHGRKVCFESGSGELSCRLIYCLRWRSRMGK